MFEREQWKKIYEQNLIMRDALQEVTAELKLAESDNILLIARIEELEAKLAKAVEIVEVVETFADRALWKVSELKGQE